MRLVLYTGKGGVGKTTTAAATAVCAARRGLRTLVVSVDPAHSLGDVLGARLGAAPSPVEARLLASEIDARRELDAHWSSVRDGIAALLRGRVADERVVEDLAILPGAEELATLIAVERLASREDFDLVVVDCAPAGAALRLVTLPDVAHGAVRLALRLVRAVAATRGALGSARAQQARVAATVARDLEQAFYVRLRALRRLLTSDATSVRLVTTPERIPIEEARRARTELSLFGLACDAVVLNRVAPDALAGEGCFRERLRAQAEHRRELGEQFAPLAVLEAPLAAEELVGPDALAAHAEALFASACPSARLARAPALRFESPRRRGARGPRRGAVCLPLPGARVETLEVAKVGGDLVVRAGDARRAIALPRALASLDVARASLARGELRVELEEPSRVEVDARADAFRAVVP